MSDILIRYFSDKNRISTQNLMISTTSSKQALYKITPHNLPLVRHRKLPNLDINSHKLLFNSLEYILGSLPFDQYTIWGIVIHSTHNHKGFIEDIFWFYILSSHKLYKKNTSYDRSREVLLGEDSFQPPTTDLMQLRFLLINPIIQYWYIFRLKGGLPTIVSCLKIDYNPSASKLALGWVSHWLKPNTM